MHDLKFKEFKERIGVSNLYMLSRVMLLSGLYVFGNKLRSLC